MPSLKEIKGRIASVRSTLKITSAMKLVSSAKLRKAQKAIEAMRPYSAAMQDIMDSLLSAGARLEGISSGGSAVVIVAIASNSSLCGAFNANVLRKVRELQQEYPDAAVYSVGRKVADAM
ncbi:MAG: F0F1 ATP synthase subunit gamma, partial [Bacteroidales bacterium]|nr:F0F1 ATP synthase subunit gamma [Bacteroidales bacterium]